MTKFSITTGKSAEMRNITREVQAAVTESGITSGICTVFVPHTTAGVNQ